jgi:hypothetical protein
MPELRLLSEKGLDTFEERVESRSDHKASGRQGTAAKFRGNCVCSCQQACHLPECGHARIGEPACDERISQGRQSGCHDYG